MQMHAIIGPCAVCTRDVQAVPIQEQLEASRGMNVPVVLASGDPVAGKPPIVRHSYCAPGTIRWARCMDRGIPRERVWLERFGFDPENLPGEEEIEMGSKKKSSTSTSKAAKAAKPAAAAKKASDDARKAGKKPSQLPYHGKPAFKDKRIPAVGTVFSREYKGKKVEVTVVDGGLRWDGTVYKSLSALAKAVTKYPSISGFQFFADALGLAEKKEQKKTA